MKLQQWLPALVLIGAVVAIFIWQNGQPTKHVEDDLAIPTVDRVVRCQKLKGVLADRVDACLDDLGTSVIRSDPKKFVQDAADAEGEGKVLLLAKADFGVGNKAVPWGAVPHLHEPLYGTDEGAAAKALREDGFRVIALSRDLIGAVDRDNQVLSRLVHHDYIEWFQLRHVTADLLIYTVRGSSMRIPVATGDSLLKGLRARLEGRRPAKQRWNPPTIRLIGTMRLQGNALVYRHVIGSNLESALDELAEKMARTWRRDVVPEGHGSLAERLREIRMEVHVVMERAPVEPRSRYFIFDFWEMGVDGMMFSQPEGAEDPKFTYMPGSESMTRSLASPDSFLRFAVREFGWYDKRPWEKDPRTQLDVIRTQHFMESKPGGIGDTVRLFRGIPEVPMDYVTEKNAQQMLISGGEWWLHNMDMRTGYVEYKYWPVQNRRSEDTNEVRHILGMRDLADTYRYRRDPRYLQGARKSMDWLMNYAIHDTDPKHPTLPHPEPGMMLFRFPSVADAAAWKKVPNQKLGTVAVGLLGWLAYAEAAETRELDEHILKLARFTKSMMQPNGKFRAYYVNKEHSYYTAVNDIVPGEAMLALGIVADYFDEPEWAEGYTKFIEYYRPWFRERAARQNPYGRWPHHTYADEDRLELVQFGPWSVMAAKQYYLMTGDKDAAAFGLEVADWMIDNYQWREARSPWPDYVGGYYKLPQELPAMQTFCYSEGTAAAYHIASTFRPEDPKYRVSTEEAIRFLEVMQWDELDSYFLARPEKVRGGVKYTMNLNKVRTDYVGHGLSTLSQYLDARAYDPALDLDIIDPTLRATWGAYDPAPLERGGEDATAPAQAP